MHLDIGPLPPRYRRTHFTAASLSPRNKAQSPVADAKSGGRRRAGRRRALYVNAFAPLALHSGSIPVAGWTNFLLVCQASGEKGPAASLRLGNPSPPARLPPGGFLGDLHEFPTSPAEGGRTAGGRDRGQFELRVRGWRHHSRLASQRGAHELVHP